ncbi:MAG: aldehyde dehydrogenase [Flavobacteriaceae bacterium]|nr:aldehyde dehydrogenase [Flavobacteriaceae bacterium]
MLLKAILDKQQTYFHQHHTKDVTFRRTQLKKLKAALQENEQLLYNAIYSDFKKSEFDTFATELALVYHEIDIARMKLSGWARKKHVSTNLINFPAQSYVIPEPLGSVLIIGAWNYPYLLTLSPMVAAMAAGCTMIVKPSEIPASTSKALLKIIAETFSPEYITVVEGGVSETTELLKLKFDKIFFTGSTAVGKIVYKAAAENLVPVTLELGGKSPAFVTSKANLKMAAKRIVWSKFLNAGQTCISPDYLMVEASIEDRFKEMIKQQIEKEKFDLENENYSQIINKKNFDRLAALIDQDKLFLGGKMNEEKRVITPTVLHKVSFDDAVMKDEIFGPILPIISYTNLDAAISEVKKLPKPLSAYVFSNSDKEKQKILTEVSFGGGGVNEAVMQITNPSLPFGGVGASGFGSYHGEHGFKAFSHMKAIVEKPNWLELPLKYFPRSKRKLWWIKQIFKI